MKSLFILLHCVFRIINPAFNTITYTAAQDGDICITTSAGVDLIYTSDVQGDTTLLPRITTNCFYLEAGETATITLKRKGANRVCVNFLPVTATSLRSSFSVNDSHVVLTAASKAIELQHTQSPDRPTWKTVYTTTPDQLGQTVKIYDLPHVTKQGTGWHYYRLKDVDTGTYSDVQGYNEEVSNDNPDTRAVQYGSTTIYLVTDTRTNQTVKQIRIK